MDTDSDSDADFSMFRAMKSAMWDPMATMFAVSIENEWFKGLDVRPLGPVVTKVCVSQRKCMVLWPSGDRSLRFLWKNEWFKALNVCSGGLM